MKEKTDKLKEKIEKDYKNMMAVINSTSLPLFVEDTIEDMHILISNLIAENKELKEENEKMEELIENSECDMSTNYIPKSKVEEEIDKLNKKEKDLQNSINDEEREEYSDANISFDLMDIDIRRETLQSLLGKEQ